MIFVPLFLPLLPDLVCFKFLRKREKKILAKENFMKKKTEHETTPQLINLGKANISSPILAQIIANLNICDFFFSGVNEFEI